MKPLHNYIFLACLLIVLALAACTNAPDPTPEGAYPVDPIFQAYYEQLGGVQRLGPAISSISQDEMGRLYQYFAAALLEYDRNNPESPVRLAPLGRELELFELPDPSASKEAVYLVDGYELDPHFIALYEALGGGQVVGRPLTAAHVNHEKGRLEQYFENLGFFWTQGDDPEAVGLLAYGAWKCDYYCRHEPPDSSLVTVPRLRLRSFVRMTALWGLDFTGLALTSPYLTESGMLNQIYENVVMQAPADAPEQVSLKPIVIELNYGGGEFEQPYPGPGMQFVPGSGATGLGYNVPQAFAEYLNAHGGLEVSGPPVTPVVTTGSGGQRQCFANLCLESRMEAGAWVIAPAPLGLTYRARILTSEEVLETPAAPRDILIQVWERYPMVTPGQAQEISVFVLGDDLPLYNLIPELTLTLPDGEEQIYAMPPTDLDGQSKILLPPISVPIGSLIDYKVCVVRDHPNRFCIRESFLVWQDPYLELTPTAPPAHIHYLPLVLRNLDIYLPAYLNRFQMFLPVVTNQ